MVIWSILSAVLASILTTLVLNFFLNRMTENAKKPCLTEPHKQIIKMLSHYNAVATVKLPNGADQNYDITITTYGRLPVEYFGAFEEMIEQKILVPTGPETYRLSYNHMSKYRKTVWRLAWEEIKLLIGLA
jgi:hypothetical protein